MPEYTFTVYNKYWPQQALDETVATINQKLASAGLATTVTYTNFTKPTRMDITFSNVPGTIRWTHKDLVDEINKRFLNLVTSY